MKGTTLRSGIVTRAIVLGGLGGVAIILTSAYSTRGPLVFVPYAGLLAALAALVGARESRFQNRFVAVLAGFGAASLIWYASIGVFRGSPSTISLFGHLWRMSFLLGVGAILALAISYITGKPSRADVSGTPRSDSSVAA